MRNIGVHVATREAVLDRMEGAMVGTMSPTEFDAAAGQGSPAGQRPEWDRFQELRVQGNASE